MDTMAGNKVRKRGNFHWHSHHPKYVQGEATDSRDRHIMAMARMKGKAIDSRFDKTEEEKAMKNLSLHFEKLKT